MSQRIHLGMAAILVLGIAFIINALLSACTAQPTATTGDQPSVPDETRSFYDSKNLDVSFSYPLGWALEESNETIYIASEQKYFPWGYEYYASSRLEPYYELYEVSSYGSLPDQLLGREQSAADIAEAIAYTFEVGPVKGTLLEPISAYTINGKEAARLIVKTPGFVHDIVLIALAPNQVIVISAMGRFNKIEAMREIVDGIAASLQKPDM